LRIKSIKHPVEQKSVSRFGEVLALLLQGSSGRDKNSVLILSGKEKVLDRGDVQAQPADEHEAQARIVQTGRD
jgi:hypothetical protein